jgi:hypothetical protein
MTNAGKRLRVGQAVAVEELAWGFRLAAPGPDGPALVVAAVAADHVVLTRGDGETVRIPGWLIKEVVDGSPEAA